MRFMYAQPSGNEQEKERNRQTDGRTDGLTDIQTDGWTEGRKYKQRDRRTAKNYKGQQEQG